MEWKQYEDIKVVKIAVNPLFPLMSVYLYFVDGMLVDTGPRIQKRNLKGIFPSWDIKQVALTHSHEDHTGMASWIAKHTDAEIFCHEEMVREANEKARIPWYRELFVGPRFAFSPKPFPDSIRTQAHTFYPIHTPGHTKDHVCLLEPNKGWLFTGDLYITPYPKVFMKEESISGYIESIKKLNTYDYQTVFCGHEGIIRNGKEMMTRKLAYLQKTRNEIIRMNRLGYTEREISKQMFPENVRLEKITFGSFSRMNLIRSCLRNN
ncbi:MBL fold hydrolase [Lentibacillus populi]|uniref:MBL fold hydrolase n=1 Tax=Lentibacillus populi TaxID=1827502 RepID=A0A9W5TVZ1_9BACI|nr:MBL fold metallo-hydrolase [Lentibacillus populi]MBT2218108.1 MBL fold metallo-hydrolase [Virgibacillus dakarensis]GGB37403.1 MBL fold hydrolase [Lentibacillus populi]